MLARVNMHVYTQIHVNIQFVRCENTGPIQMSSLWTLGPLCVLCESLCPELCRGRIRCVDSPERVVGSILHTVYLNLAATVKQQCSCVI